MSPWQEGRCVSNRSRLPRPNSTDEIPVGSGPCCGGPYFGLRPHLAGDAPLFHGREVELQQSIRRLASPRVRPPMVVGASGSGKSSLLAAGLAPRWTANGAGTPWTTTTPRAGSKAPSARRRSPSTRHSTRRDGRTAGPSSSGSSTSAPPDPSVATPRSPSCPTTSSSSPPPFANAGLLTVDGDSVTPPTRPSSPPGRADAALPSASATADYVRWRDDDEVASLLSLRAGADARHTRDVAHPRPRTRPRTRWPPTGSTPPPRHYRRCSTPAAPTCRARRLRQPGGRRPRGVHRALRTRQPVGREPARHLRRRGDQPAQPRRPDSRRATPTPTSAWSTSPIPPAPRFG